MIKPFQMYSVGNEQRQTLNIFDVQGRMLVNYKSHAGTAVGELAYVDGGVPVHTCLAKDFAQWAAGEGTARQAA